MAVAGLDRPDPVGQQLNGRHTVSERRFQASDECAVTCLGYPVGPHGADWFRRWDLEVERATRVVSDSLNRDTQRTADNEQFALAA